MRTDGGCSDLAVMVMVMVAMVVLVMVVVVMIVSSIKEMVMGSKLI